MVTTYFDNIPFDMICRPQWAVCNSNKQPYNPNTNILIDITTPANWSNFETCRSTVTSGLFSGLGFCLAEGGNLTCIDLDKTNDPNIMTRQQQLSIDFADTYQEISWNGGLHIWCYGTIPTNMKTKGIEIYSSKRFMIVTGNVYNPKPIAPNHQTLVELSGANPSPATPQVIYDQPQTKSDEQVLMQGANEPHNGERFNLLYHGKDKEAGYVSTSEADFAFIDMIQHYSKNKAQILRIFLDSELGKRLKVQKRIDDYVKPMIDKSFDQDRSITTNWSFNRPRISDHKFGSLDAATLDTQKFTEIKYIVPGYIIEGLTLLVGKPKIGKSWMAYQIANAVATGGKIFGEKCEQGDVLCCFLEDNKRRLQSRLRKLVGDEKVPKSPNLYLEWEMLRVNQGGIEQLKEWIKEHKDVRLIVIDTLKMVRPIKGNKQSAYDFDYDSLLPLRNLVNETGIAIVVLHHDRKLGAEDVFDTVSGTQGIQGAPDSVIIIKRDRNGIMFSGHGRELAPFDKLAFFNRETCLWSLAAGDAEYARQSNERKVVLKVIQDAGKPVKLSDIIAATGFTRDSVNWLLKGLCEAGSIEQPNRGFYSTIHTSTLFSTKH